MKNIMQQVAAKAVIVNDEGQVLILREAAAHVTNTKAERYELPGGRLELGEGFHAALAREVYEETGLKVEQLYPILVGEWRPVIKAIPHQIIGVFIVCRAKSSNVRLSEEHDEFKWIKPATYKRYNVLPPDCEAIARYAEGLPG